MNLPKNLGMFVLAFWRIVTRLSAFGSLGILIPLLAMAASTLLLVGRQHLWPSGMPGYRDRGIAMRRHIALPLIMLIGLSILTTGCTSVLASTSKPTVTITSPASNSEFQVGEQVAVQSNSIDPVGVARVQLAVDGNIVRTDASPTPQPSYTLIQTWAATPGVHLITLRAINVANVSSDPAEVYVSVLPAGTPTPISTPTATRSCVNNSIFIADVTVPDGTAVAPGQAFNKIWRVRNTGTCAWGAGDQLVFVGGEAMTTAAAIAVPSTAPGSTADLLIALAAPATPGIHVGSWRLKNSNSGFFGATLDLKINVITPAANCPFTPVIDSFGASPTTITVGQSATLSWGFVRGAEKAEIDNDIGGVATPGSVTVNPTTTTTYTLTATCGSKVRIAQVTITVNPSATSTPAPTNTPTRTPTP